ncbi:hypothetical protein, unlikely [Trypanosoma brucei brucei TREU927]|uniref:Uncharacterized protein n=1 Tax=Trypanosoma brucei brucei (strain 927/4 GUTat10.1) TaxID=185431 RepID=Q387V7_TRYB2|nr:hypothetical protein, unlikely [Trypanosoma brucei brucei TREU927]EAN78915.1 hypothetical protein, unlikely [Trypanosoma brucei brucei TREU927]
MTPCFHSPFLHSRYQFVGVGVLFICTCLFAGFTALLNQYHPLKAAREHPSGFVRWQCKGDWKRMSVHRGLRSFFRTHAKGKYVHVRVAVCACGFFIDASSRPNRGDTYQRLHTIKLHLLLMYPHVQPQPLFFSDFPSCLQHAH